MKPIPLINYKGLRKSNPESDRQAVIQCLHCLDNNISATAGTFGINRPVVYDIIAKYHQVDFTEAP